MTLPPSNTSAPGDADQTPVGSTSSVRAESTPPALTVEPFGYVITPGRFADTQRVDQLARKTITAWGEIDFDHRVLLGDRHPGLVEALLLLEDAFDRIDGR